MKKFNPQRRVWRDGRIWDESKYVPHQGAADCQTGFMALIESFGVLK